MSYIGNCTLTPVTHLKLYSDPGYERAAVIMGLLATAKTNGHEPHAWLTDVLTRLPTTKDRDIGTLLPHTWRCGR